MLISTLVYKREINPFAYITVLSLLLDLVFQFFSLFALAVGLFKVYLGLYHVWSTITFVVLFIQSILAIVTAKPVEISYPYSSNSEISQ